MPIKQHTPSVCTNRVYTIICWHGHMLTAVYSLFREAVVSILLQEQECPKCPKNKRA